MTCTKCGADKEAGAFPPDQRNPLRGGRSSNCRTCAVTANRRQKYPKKFGITLEQYDEMLTAQGGVCAICKQPEAVSREQALAVDHDHTRNVVRAILCNRCNRALGFFRDDPALLRAAAAYLEAHA